MQAPIETTAGTVQPAISSSPGISQVQPQTQPQTASQQPAASTSKRARRSLAARPIPSALYDKIGTSLGLILAVALSLALWLIGAKFTLDFLKAMGLALAAIGLAAWLIPLTISAAELWLWPDDSGWQRWAIWLAVLVFDVGSSWAGFVAWGAGRAVPLFNGFNLPDSGWPLHIIALMLGLSFAFLPEKLGRWALSELRRIWG